MLIVGFSATLPPKTGHERLTGLARQRRSGTGIHAEIERRGDVRDAGEVDGSMAMGAGNVDEQLLGDRIRHRFIVRRHCAIQRDRQQAAGQREATESPGQGEPRKRCEAEGCGHWHSLRSVTIYITGL